MIDFSKLAQVTDSFHKESNTTKSKIKDSAKRRFIIRKAIKDSAKRKFTIRKAIKDNEDKTIEQLQAILAANGYEVSAEELEAARQQFESDKIRDNEDANHQEASEGAPGNDVKHTTPSNDKEVEKPAGAGQVEGDSPIPDSLKKKVADALGETDSTEAAIKAALECINPDEGATAEAVLSAVTEVLSGTIDTLEAQLPSVEEGSEENNPGNNPEVLGDSAKKKLSDSKKASMKKRIRDAMEETTTTEDAIEAAVSNIDPEATPEDVCETVIEIMSEIINELQSENDNGASEEEPAE